MVVARKWVVNYLGDVPGGQFNFDFSSEKSTFALKEEEISEDDLKDGEILIKSLYYGNDPTQKFWISSIDKNYSKGKEVGDLVPAVGLAEVVASRNKEYRVGDFIKGMIGWATYTILSDLSGLQKISADGVRDISWHITLFGIPAMTAFFNLFEYAGLKETEAHYGKVYLISGAAGGVGTMSIQLALNVFKASKVIAVAGGQEKVKYLESFGDKVVGVDYKDANFAKNLVAAAGSENTVDYFIDNVGGDTLELGVNLLLKPHATLISCGIISGYNDPSKLAFKSYPTVISKRLTIRGVLLSDHYSEFPVAMKKLTQWVEDGKVDIEKTVTIEDGTGDNFKNVPLIWNGLYEGKNIGRLVTKVASPEKDAKL